MTILNEYDIKTKQDLELFISSHKLMRLEWGNVYLGLIEAVRLIIDNDNDDNLKIKYYELCLTEYALIRAILKADNKLYKNLNKEFYLKEKGKK